MTRLRGSKGAQKTLPPVQAASTSTTAAAPPVGDHVASIVAATPVHRAPGPPAPPSPSLTAQGINQKRLRDLITLAQTSGGDGDIGVYVVDMLRNNEPRRALEAATRLILVDPSVPDFYVIRANVHQYMALTQGNLKHAARAHDDRAKAIRLGAKPYEPLWSAMHHLVDAGLGDNRLDGFVIESLKRQRLPAACCFRTADLAISRSHVQVARHLIEHALKVEPEHAKQAKYQAFLAADLLGCKRYEEAAAAALQCLERNPHHVACSGILPNALAASNQPQLALKWTHAALQQHITEPTVMYWLARTGQLLLDAPLLDTLLQHFSSHAVGCAAAWRELARAFTWAEQDSQAAATWLRAIELEPECIEAYAPCASACMATQQVGRAVDVLRAATTREKENIELLRLLASALAAAEGLDGSSRAEEQTIVLGRINALDPHNAAELRLCGQLFISLGQPKEAVKPLRRACALDPAHLTTQRALAHACMAAQSHFQTSVEALQSVISLDPSDWQAPMQLGALLLRQKKLHDAVAAFEVAASRKPQHIPAWLNLTHLHLEQATKKSLCKQTDSAFDSKLLAYKKLAQGWQAGELEKDAYKDVFGADTPKLPGDAQRLAALSRALLTDAAVLTEQPKQAAALIPTPVVVPPASDRADNAPLRVTLQPQNITGTLRGLNFQGYPTVTDDAGQDHLSADANLRSLWREHCGDPLSNIAAANIQHASNKLDQALTALLQQKITSEHTVLSFMQTLCADTPYRCYLGGGVVRDALYDVTRDSATPYQPSHDIDLIFTGPPQAAMQAGQRMGKKMTSPLASLYRGTVTFNGDHGLLGLDISSVCVAHAFAKPGFRQSPDGSGSLAIFGTNLQRGASTRDFLCNTLVYDPTAKLLIDPLGGGVDDVREKRLTVASAEALRNPTLGLRALKMLARGWHLQQATLQQVRQNMETYLADPNTMAAGVVRLAPSTLSTRKELSAWLQQWLLPLMKEHHFAHLGKQYIWPFRQTIAARYAWKYLISETLWQA